MKKFVLVLLLSVSFMATAQSTFQVEITNMTRNQIFSPPLAVVHQRDASVFEVGQPASQALYTMAEDGDASMLAAELGDSDAVGDVVLSEGPLMPGQSVILDVNVDYPYSQISVLGMLVTTNDAFFAASLESPRPLYFKSVQELVPPRTVSTFGHVFDAGSEANSEDCTYIPGPPCGNGGARDTENAEGFIHIHPGIQGDADLSHQGYNWAGPVVRVRVAYRFDNAESRTK